MNLEASVALRKITSGGPGSGRRPGFGPVMYAKSWLGGKKMNVPELAAHLNKNGMAQGTIVSIHEHKDDGSTRTMHVIGSGTHEGYAQGNPVGQRTDWYKDTGLGHQYPHTDVSVQNHTSFKDGKVAGSSNGTAAHNERGSAYVFK